MDLKIEWNVGLNSRHVFFIDDNTIAYISGQYVCFSDDNDRKSYMPLPSYAATGLSVHPSEGTFTLWETNKINPDVFIYSYPYLEQKGVLKGAAKLAIMKVSFSQSCYLAVLSGVPDFTLSLWNFRNQQSLCTISLPIDITADVSICPINWRSITVIDNFNVYLVTVEHCRNLYTMNYELVKLPSVTTSIGCQGNAIIEDSRTTVNRMTSNNFIYNIELPPSSVAGVSSQFFQEFIESQDFEIRCKCVSHAWSATGDLYFGCEGGQIVHLDMEKMTFMMIFNCNENANDTLRIRTPVSRMDNIDLSNCVKAMCFAKEGIFIGGDDGILRIVKMVDNEISDKIEDVHKISGTISSLAFNFKYTRLSITSSDNIVQLLSAYENVDNQKTIMDIGRGELVGVSFLPDQNYFVSVRKNGLLQTWSSTTQQKLATLDICQTVQCLDSSPLWSITAVGLDNGYLCIFDVRDVSKPRLIHNIKLHDGPILKLQFDKRSQILATGGNDGVVMILSGLVSEHFRVIGSTNFEGNLLDLTVFNNPTSDDIGQIAVLSRSGKANEGGNRLTYFEIPTSVFMDPTNFYENLNGTFEEDAIRKMNLNFDPPVYGCALGVQPQEERSPCVFAVDIASRCLSKYQIPAVPPKKAGNKASYLKPVFVFTKFIHEDPNVNIQSSINNRILMTYGVDGVVRLVDVKEEMTFAQVPAHQVSLGGVRAAAFALNSNSFLSCGSDNSIILHKLILEADLEFQNNTDFDSLISKFGGKIGHQNSELNSHGSIKLDHDAMKDCKTWSQNRVFERQAEEDQKYFSIKNQIQSGIDVIRGTIVQMVKENEDLDELEKIDRQEFELDVVMKNKLLDDIAKEVQKQKEEIELNNLAKQFIMDVIKKECWEQMSVKGRSLCAFNSSVEVSNFPLKDRPQNVLDQIDMVVKRRMIELEDAIDRRQYTECLTKSSMNQEDTDEVDEEEAREKASITTSEMKEYESLAKIAPNFKYLYPQTELETRDQKIYQIILLQDIIYQLKVSFNKEFSDVYQKKEQEINRIKEKNSRITKILTDIDMKDLIQPDPELSNSEKPEKLLVVEDKEVKVEKYLTDDERKRLEEERLAEEERKRREKLDNWRERGLDDMMGGVLEVKREDELKKDVPKPAFLLAEKSQEEWTDEEKKLYEEYERKVKDLTEEREKYKKQLEAESKKLTGIIEDAKATFDDLLINLFNKQIIIQMSVFQEEVKILRLQASLLIDEELTNRKREILELMKNNRIDKQNLKEILSKAKTIVDESQETYDEITAEEKVMDKSFKKEYTDVHGAMLEVITKLYKRRPRNRLYATQIVSAAQMPNYAKNNPYLIRPPSEKQKNFRNDALQNAIHELNKIDMVDTIDQALYDRLCKTRKKRIEREFEIKEMAYDIAEMQSFLQKRYEEERNLENSEKHCKYLMELYENFRYQFYINKEIQFVMKQGQVEVEAVAAYIHDFTDSILIHRSVIEQLNKEIKSNGKTKVQHMIKAKDSKKKFIHLEWDLKRMLMEYEDLVTKMKEIQCFKITKEIQRYLATNDYDGLINAEIQKMEQMIISLKQHQHRNVDKKKSRFKNINEKTLYRIKSDNSDLSQQLTELNVQANEKRHIFSGFPSEVLGQKNVEKRYQKILQRQHLVDLAKSQAREVAVLRSEVERLRMRTFPALVQPK